MVNFKTFEINLNSRIFKEWEESYDMIDRLWWPQFFMIFKIVKITLWSTCWTELRIDVLFPALPIYLQLNYEEIGDLNYFHLIFEIFCNLLVQPSHFPQCMYALVPLDPHSAHRLVCTSSFGCISVRATIILWQRTRRCAPIIFTRSSWNVVAANTIHHTPCSPVQTSHSLTLNWFITEIPSRNCIYFF